VKPYPYASRKPSNLVLEDPEEVSAAADATADFAIEKSEHPEQTPQQRDNEEAVQEFPEALH